MKAKFKLTVDPYTHQPLIKFRHYDKDNSNGQLLLKVFLEAAKDGIELRNPSGFIDSEGGSFENYEIRPITMDKLEEK